MRGRGIRRDKWLGSPGASEVKKVPPEGLGDTHARRRGRWRKVAPWTTEYSFNDRTRTDREVTVRSGPHLTRHRTHLWPRQSEDLRVRNRDWPVLSVSRLWTTSFGLIVSEEKPYEQPWVERYDCRNVIKEKEDLNGSSSDLLTVRGVISGTSHPMVTPNQDRSLFTKANRVGQGS